MGRVYQVLVEGFGREKTVIDLCNTEEQFKSMTVLQLKEKIAQWQPGHADVKDLRLIFSVNRLDEDSRLLCEYGVQHRSVIQVVLWMPGGGEGPLPPDREDGGMGDKDGRNKSFEAADDESEYDGLPYCFEPECTDQELFERRIRRQREEQQAREQHTAARPRIDGTW